MTEKYRPEPKWVSPGDACIIGGFGMTQCYELINEGVLISKKLGRKRLIFVDSIHNAGEFHPVTRADATR